MLFDLRGRGRRRTVRVIYTGLALLMGVGLVAFGIGGGFGGGGLLSSIGKEGEGGGSGGYSKQIAKYRKLTKQQPSSTSAWENLAKNLYHEAGNEPYVTSTGAVTSKGKELFKKVAEAWSSYIALNPPKPNSELAQQMEGVYGEEGLDEPAKEVEVLQFVLADRPTYAAGYAALAEYAYKAHNTRVGDLASEKAVTLAPSADRARVKAELAEVKANPSGEKTYTTTTNGKTYTGKLNAKKELQATEVKTTSSTGKSSSTTKK
jgi:ribosomal protein L33